VRAKYLKENRKKTGSKQEAGGQPDHLKDLTPGRSLPNHLKKKKNHRKNRQTKTNKTNVTRVFEAIVWDRRP